MLNAKSKIEAKIPENCLIYNASSKNVLLPNAKIAIRDEDRFRGFQFAKELKLDDAILFVFDEEDVHAMHMRNVIFPLLMIWMGVDQVIRSIVLAEPSDTLLFSSVYPAYYCLECNPALSQLVQIGDTLKFVEL